MAHGNGRQMARGSHRHRAVRAAVALTVMGLVAAGSSLIAPTASAAGILPTTTTLAAAPAASTEGDAVTLTAAVKVLGLPGLGITPTGIVSFSAINGTSTTPLGSKALGSCLLKTCTASITTTAIPVGTTSVKASYAGDLLAAASSGHAAVSVAPLPDPEPEPDAETEEVCGATATCATDTITSPDGSTQLQVTSNGGNQTVTASLTEGAELQCPSQDDLDTGGALATFNSTSESAGKTVVYRLFGSAAVNMDANYGAHTSYLGCYASPNPFNGYTSGAFGPATFDSEDGLFKAQLNNCANNSGEKPCFTFVNALALDPPYVEVIIQTPPGDPNFR